MVASKCIDGSIFNKFDVLFITLRFLIPPFNNIDRISQIHPQIADAEGNIDEKTIIPDATLACKGI